MSVRKSIVCTAALLIVSLLLAPQHSAAQNSSNPYSIIEGWAKLPSGRNMGAVGKATVDPDGRHIWAVIRCDAGPERFGTECLDSDLPPVSKFDPDGNLVEAFGSGMFIWPHGIDVDSDGNVWVTDAVSENNIPAGDDRGHHVIKFSPTGEVLMTLGTPGEEGDGPNHFTSPSDVAVAPNGDVFIADGHGRDHRTHAALALDAEGRFLGLRVSAVANLGAYLSTFGPGVPAGAGVPLYVGLYDFAAAHVEIKAVFTNTVPVDAYRGAGRPESNYVVERLIDKAGREQGLHGAELRRRNFVTPERMPYRTALGYVYDSGEFARNLDDAVRIGGRPGFATRRSAAKARHKLAGLGLASYIHATPGGDGETAHLKIDGAGTLTLLNGGQSNGQGHFTTFAQVLADALAVPVASVAVAQGDTDRIAEGSGTGGSRTLLHGAAAIMDAAAKIIERGKRVAGEMLEAAPADIAFANGGFAIRGTDRRLGLFEVAAYAERAGEPLAALGAAPAERSFPNGCHVCEVEVDPDTGVTEIVRYTFVDDLGTLVNPLLAAGQVHGGTVQGIG